MRSGGCTLQQALTVEAASMVKQAVNLARRRGHAHVTPLHVANTMLTSSTGILRTACLDSHSHPLQCKALELCFNVALNRLPSSTSSPMLGHHAHHPSLSNALVAAFKRAQAHQRRGSIENQQQPLLAVKVELEQLIISILDDPSVSRVMREAGFSSTQVKSNVEQAVSLQICEANTPVSGKSKDVPNNLIIPTGSLGLSLSPDSDSQEQLRSMIATNGSGWSLLHNRLEKPLSSFADPSKFGTEVQGQTNSTAHGSSTTSNSTLPSWLQQYKDENRRLICNDRECLQVSDLCQKWSSICSSEQKHHHLPDKTLNVYSKSSSSSITSYDNHCRPSLHQTHQTWPAWKEHPVWVSDPFDEGFDSNSRVCSDPKSVLLSNPDHNTSPNSASSSNTLEVECPLRFKELNAENLKTLCNALEDKLTWHQDIIPGIASTILRCRSGMIRRKGMSRPNEIKEETWLLFEGGNNEGNEKIGRELANLIFGSQSNFISIASSNFSSPTRSESTEDLRNKRSRDESSCSYLERFADAISRNPHCVFVLEDIEQLDYFSQVGLKNVIERGRTRNSNGDEVRLHDAIIILSCESFDSRLRASSPVKQRFVSLDLNLSSNDVDDSSFDDMGLVDSVDGRFVFKLQEEIEKWEIGRAHV